MRSVEDRTTVDAVALCHSVSRVERHRGQKRIVVIRGRSESQKGYFHIRRSGGGGGLAPNFASENIGDRYPKFCPLNFRYNPKCPQNCDSFPIFASCSDRIPQIFPLIW